MGEIKRFTEVIIKETGEMGLIEAKEDEHSYWIDVNFSVRLYENEEFIIK